MASFHKKTAGLFYVVTIIFSILHIGRYISSKYVNFVYVPTVYVPSNNTLNHVMICSDDNHINLNKIPSFISFVNNNNNINNIHIYYSNSICLETLHKINISNINYITLHRLNLKELSLNTPIESFIKNHAYNRLKRGKEFENDMVKINALLVLNKIIKMGNQNIYIDLNNMDDKIIINQNDSQLIYNILRDINTKYSLYNLGDLKSKWPLNFDMNIFHQFKTLTINNHINNNKQQSYAILSHDHRVQTTGSQNVNSGDETQTFSALQFIPFIDRFIDRDNWKIDNYNSNDVVYINKTEVITVFLNAWYGDRGMIWPPSSQFIDPLLISMHFSSGFINKIGTQNSINYFKDYKFKVGARDTETLNVLKKNNIDSYFSGCATLLIQSISSISNNKDKHILIVDVNSKVMNKILKVMLPISLHNKLIYISQNIYDKQLANNRMSRYNYSYNILKHISNSLFVITSRIHTALPSVAMNISVIFINIGELPGGGGKRTAGLLDLFHTINDINDINDDFIKHFNVFNPPINPNYDKFIHLRSSMFYNIKQFDTNNKLYDNAVTFGVIPFKINKYYQKPYNIIFHQIYTSDLNKMSSRNRRSIESIFHHYPNAKLYIFSNNNNNNIPPGDHDSIQDFIDLGFDISIINYSLNDLLQKMPEIDKSLIKNFIQNKLPKIRTKKFWYSHETDLIRLLAMYIYGGIYMDTDVLLINNKMHNLAVNVLGWQNNESINGAIMKFEQHSEFIKLCIIEYLTNYKAELWAYNGPDLLTRIAHNNEHKICGVGFKSESKCILNVLQTSAFQPIPHEEIKKICFQDKMDEKLFEYIMNNTYAMHFNNKMTGNIKETKKETLCNVLFNKFCLFCSVSV